MTVYTGLSNSLQEQPGKRYLRLSLRRDALGILGAIMVFGLVLLVILGPKLAPYDPLKINFPDKLEGPSAKHWFGTDEIGRDMFSRVLHGARISLKASLIVVTIATGLGVTLGTLAGYYGGWVDEVIMRTADVFMAFPGLVLAMAVSAAVGASLEAAIFAVSFVWWPIYTRLTRGQILKIREEVFVEAARAIGLPSIRIMLRHILPSVLPVLLVRMTMDSGYAVLFTASLSFIGLGAQEPTPEWGRMVATGRAWIIDYGYYPAFPGLAIAYTVLAFSLLGDGIRDWLDPKDSSRR